MSSRLIAMQEVDKNGAIGGRKRKETTSWEEREQKVDCEEGVDKMAGAMGGRKGKRKKSWEEKEQKVDSKARSGQDGETMGDACM